MNPTDYLDQLDQAHEKATPGPWVNDSHEIYQAVPGMPELINGGEWIGETCRVDDPRSDADASLIVAAVNALPELTGALRAALQAADELHVDPLLRRHDLASYVTGRVRDAITAALGGVA